MCRSSHFFEAHENDFAEEVMKKTTKAGVFKRSSCPAEVIAREPRDFRHSFCPTSSSRFSRKQTHVVAPPKFWKLADAHNPP
jgi:hypothetical protein